MIILIGLMVGILLGILLPIEISKTYTTYLAVGLLAALDSVFGGLNSNMKGRFNVKIFLSGFFGNAAIAVLLTYLGTRLGIDLYLAAVVTFGSRLFRNFAEIRRNLLNGSKMTVNLPTGQNENIEYVEND